MKNNKHKLAEWVGDYTDGYVDIPWPLVHSQAGNDAVNWLNKQDPCRVQMILENDSGKMELWAEFYDRRAEVEYALRFAK